ncbi:amidase domain-containing protein [Pullulanibacillus sp. KACC 23026]|uniref:amidase domain-containing protein n=1 Tax=Pullulanibacillus sp. KACC 23026 TaxID=3028315 RepID=UPI0023AFAD76|nr:amidase domain-containing protein [Pullulanibacillus sp. KACC 23026]WEG12158.1 amidase domain-containing protein [Pullulanibacillus sp. KACC 23026]
MSWREAWREHVKKTGDFWVDRTHDRYEVIDEKERSQTMRKKRSMRDRSAQIVKSTVDARVVGHQKVDNQDQVRYVLHLTFLIKQGDLFYIEEQEIEKEGIFDGDVLITDRTLNQEKNLDTRMKITFPEPRVQSSGTARYTYDRQAAVKYAEKWWNSYNPAYPKFEVDCTNYVSQCLKAGGAPMSHIGEKGKGWWCRGKDCSYSWSVANALRWFLASDGNSVGAVTVEEPEELVPGDVICYDWEGDGKWNHNTIVTGQDRDGMPLVNAHTYNSRNRYWAYEDSPAYTENTQYKFFHINAD